MTRTTSSHRRGTLSPTFRRVAALIATVSVFALAAPAAAGAGDKIAPPTQEHCVAWVGEPEKSGEMKVLNYECFTTPQAARAAELEAVAGKAERSGVSAESALLATKIAIHYDNVALTGSSLSVNGTSCTGGYINMSGTLANWDNRVTSTANLLCTSVGHWTNLNLTGLTEVLYISGNLSATLDNQSSSIQYN